MHIDEIFGNKKTNLEIEIGIIIINFNDLVMKLKNITLQELLLFFLAYLGGEINNDLVNSKFHCDYIFFLIYILLISKITI